MQSSSPQQETPSRQFIDLTPTWGEIGNVVMRLALCGETQALRHMTQDVARAFAAAQALKVVRDSLTDEQHEQVTRAFAGEMEKQGFKEGKQS